jgi:glyoxylase-like metal-dependent hydrolase (beta-lactamase superfamily II)
MVATTRAEAQRDTASATAPPARWCDLVPRAEFSALQRVPVRGDWFQVYLADPGVYAISEPYQFQEVISYLIVGTERALLFDTGLGIGSMRDVVAQLTRLPVTVLNSHTHYDHVGGNADFDRVLVRDTPYTRANAGGFPHEAVAGEIAPDALCRALPAGFDSAGYRTRPYTPAGFVKDGDRLDLGGRRIEVLEVPGHTPDAIALLDRRAGLLWTGDSFYEAPIWLYVPETDLDAYARSVDRMAALVPALRKLLGAHNVAVSDPALLPLLKRALADVRGGRVRGIDRGHNQIEFPFGRFSILTSRQLLEGRHGARDAGGSGLTTWR